MNLFEIVCIVAIFGIGFVSGMHWALMIVTHHLYGKLNPWSIEGKLIKKEHKMIFNRKVK